LNAYDQPYRTEDDHKIVRDLIIEESNEQVYEYIMRYSDRSFHETLLLATATRFNVEKQPRNTFTRIINLKRLNDIRRINKFLEAINDKLPSGGIFVGCVETNMLRKMRILKKYPPGLNYFIYTLDFLWKRVMPKLKWTKKIYFLLTSGENRLLSKAETYGRLYSCGFTIVDEARIRELHYFVVKKVKDPAFDYHPTYGLIIRLHRIGKHGKMIKVRKLRTMHPYSEYLQGYVFDKNNLEEGGKFANDFRLTTLGRIMRMYWIDELPMLFNLFKGDMKLVGVRPLSPQYFSLYTKELQDMRIRHKPGLIPPYYADLPKNFEEILESEKRYLQAYEKNPVITDLRYFFKTAYNIIFKKVRSK
jgi:lipopolysaccharide/colanic/teichoic acid biosynthesis glycosyltransferase